MDFTDPHWESLESAYRIQYDPRAAFRRLGDGSDEVWWELWEELYHQGDVGTASYAAIAMLGEQDQENIWTDSNVYLLAYMVEEARQKPDNPDVPAWLKASYKAALKKIEQRALDQFRNVDCEDLASAIIGLLAQSKRQIALAAFATFSEDERKAFLKDAGWA